MNQRMDAVKCTRCCTLNYKFHLHSSARIVYLRTQARGKRKYILCFEGGLSHSGLTQPQNKGQFPSKGLAGHPPRPPPIKKLQIEFHRYMMYDLIYDMIYDMI